MAGLAGVAWSCRCGVSPQAIGGISEVNCFYLLNFLFSASVEDAKVICPSGMKCG